MTVEIRVNIFLFFATSWFSNFLGILLSCARSPCLLCHKLMPYRESFYRASVRILLKAIFKTLGIFLVVDIEVNPSLFLPQWPNMGLLFVNLLYCMSMIPVECSPYQGDLSLSISSCCWYAIATLMQSVVTERLNPNQPDHL